MSFNPFAHRAPCGGWQNPQKVILGGPSQHWRDSDNGVQVWENVTMTNNEFCVEACGVPPNPCTSPWVKPHCVNECHFDEFEPGSDLLRCHAASCGLRNIPVNVYQPTARTVDFAICRKIGFKNAYAISQWPGRYGWLHLDGAQWGLYCTAEPAHLNPPDTKYLGNLSTATGHTHFPLGLFHDPPGDINFTGVVTRGYLVTQYGRINMTACADSGDTSLAMVYGHEFDWQDIRDIALAAANTFSPSVVSTDYVSFINAFLSYASHADTFHPDIIDSYRALSFYMSPALVTLTIEDHSHPANGFNFDNVQTWYLTPTQQSFRYDNSQVILPLETPANDDATYNDSHWTWDMSLSNPYSSQAVNDKCDFLLGLMPWTDDKAQHWRSDADVTLGPLLTFNEKPAAPPTFTACQINLGTTLNPNWVPWFDQGSMPRPEMPDGAIIGQLNPAGYEPYFDFRHKRWLKIGDSDTGEDWEVTCYGEPAPPQIPHATQWLDNLEQQFVPPGPFIAYNILTNPFKFTTCFRPIKVIGGLMKCAWAEIVMFEKPGHNFARPCGFDLNEIDPASIDCVTNPDGNPRWPGRPCFCNDPTQIASCDTALHPNNDYVWNDSIRRGEFSVDFWDYNFRAFWESYRTRQQEWGIQIRNENCAAAHTPCKPPSCPSPGSLPPFNYTEDRSQMVTGASIGSGAWWLERMTREGHCAVHEECYPAVVYVMPNPPAFRASNSIFIQMPYRAPDDRYGTLWLGRVNQWMGDPLWAFPGRGYEDRLCPDSGCDVVKEDDGSCLEDFVDEVTGKFICFVPMRPWEENISVAPPFSPPLAAGSLGCPNVVGTINAGGSAPGRCFPPISIELDYDDGSTGCGRAYVGPFTFPLGAFTPWQVLLKQEECVRRGGRFAAEYIANGIFVQDSLTV